MLGGPEPQLQDCHTPIGPEEEDGSEACRNPARPGPLAGQDLARGPHGGGGGWALWP